MKIARDTKIRKPPHPSERVRYYIFEKKEAGHNGSGLNSVTGGDCARYIRILSFKWGIVGQPCAITP